VCRPREAAPQSHLGQDRQDYVLKLGKSQRLHDDTDDRTVDEVFSWVFDAMIHFMPYEASWLYLSTVGRTVNGSEGPLAEMCAFFHLLLAWK